jgi:hypothetical protein
MKAIMERIIVFETNYKKNLDDLKKANEPPVDESLIAKE